MSDFSSWLQLKSLYLEGEETFTWIENDTASRRPQENRFRGWIDGLDLKRYRYEWESLFWSQAEGEEVADRRNVLRICAGGDVLDELVRYNDFPGQVKQRARYSGTEYGEGILICTGLWGLPPFMKVGAFQPFAEMREGRAAPEEMSGTNRQVYRMLDRWTLTEFVVTWDVEKNTFASVETVRRGMSEILLEKVRQQIELTEEEKQRLQTDAQLVNWHNFSYDDFVEEPQTGIYFPRRIVVRGGRLSFDWERATTIRKLEVNVALPETLFRLDEKIA